MARYIVEPFEAASKNKTATKYRIKDTKRGRYIPDAVFSQKEVAERAAGAWEDTVES
jgi:hypothetical protein